MQTKSLPALGLDIGGKRTGVALSDPGRSIASPLVTVPTADIEHLIASQLEQGLSFIVVGKPTQMNGQPSESEPLIQSVVERLNRRWPNLPVFWQDERFSSKLSSRLLVEMGVPKKKRQDKSLIDQMSASLILQDFLDRQSRNDSEMTNFRG